MTSKRNNKKLIYAIIALFLLVITVICGRGIIPAFADTSGYTSALTDLQKDKGFKASKYPYVKDDYSIQVIQIAESTDNELFVYTYQPCQLSLKLVAKQVNMSLSETVDGTKLYKLTLISSSGVFCKYIVNDVKVSSDNVRFYNITSINRDWIKGIDDETGNDNIKNAVAHPVGKCFIAQTENGNITYLFKGVQVIQILNPFVDFLRYSDGFHWEFLKDHWEYTDVHYIAFNTDLPIDNLIEADVTFCEQDYEIFIDKFKLKGEKREHLPITVRGTEKGGNAADGFFAKKYEWSRIQRVDNFKKLDGLKSKTVEQLKDSKWVLLFYETEVKRMQIDVAHDCVEQGVKVTDVSILRLKFDTAGQLYNLGAVSDSITSDNKPGNDNTADKVSFFVYVWSCIVKLFKGTANFQEKFVAIIVLVVVFLLLPALLIVLNIFVPAVRRVFAVIGKGIGFGLKYLFIGLCYVVSSPVMFIIWIVQKMRGE